MEEISLEKHIENLKKYIKEDVVIEKDDSDFAQYCKGHCEDIQAVLEELEILQEYKKIAELTKISCCTAQNCEALNNAIKAGLENNKLKEELNRSIKPEVIEEKIKICEQVYEKEMKPYQRDYGIDVSMLNKKEKAELVNKRNCLLVQIETYKSLLNKEN